MKQRMKTNRMGVFKALVKTVITFVTMKIVFSTPHSVEDAITRLIYPS